MSNCNLDATRFGALTSQFCVEVGNFLLVDVLELGLDELTRVHNVLFKRCLWDYIRACCLVCISETSVQVLVFKIVLSWMVLDVRI